MDRPTKDKTRRNSEKRREKSRDAARQRRTQETIVFTELAKILPLPERKASQLDKATIMRLTLATLKQTQVTALLSHDKSGEKTTKELEEINDLEQRTLALYPKALDGFLLIISKDGEIIFLSEQILKILGIQRIEFLGQNIFEYTHECDHDEFREMLSPKFNLCKQDPYRRSFSVRMKCTLLSKGRNINVKSTSYKVIKFTGKLILPPDSQKCHNEAGGNFMTYLFAFGEEIPHPSNIEVPLGHKTFLSKHSMDMKFTIWDEKIKELVGYNSDDIIGRPIFDYYHALDGEVVGKAFKDLIGKDQIMTEQYRFLAKKGGHVWVITQATVIYDPRSHKSQYVVCVHYVLSEIQNRDEILSVVQTSGSDDEEEEEEEEADIKEEIAVEVSEDKEVLRMKCLQSSSEDPIPGPQLNTEKIFAPKTKDMDEDLFLQSSTAIPVDECLTYRAPSAGDVCISLSLNFPTCDLNLADPSLDILGLEDPPSEDKNLLDSNEDGLFESSPHVTPTMTSPADYHLNSSLDEDIFVQFSKMDNDLKFNRMTQKKYFDRGKRPYNQDDLERVLFPNGKLKPFCKDEMVFNMKSSASGKKSPNPDLPKNVPRTQIKQTGARLLYPKRPIDISCLEKGPPEKNLKLDSSLPPFFGSFFGEESMNSAIVGDLNLADPSLDILGLEDPPSEDKNLLDSNEDGLFESSPHVTPTMTSPADYHLNSSLDEDIFVQFSKMDNDLKFNRMTQKKYFDRGKRPYNQDDLERVLFPNGKLKPFCKDEMVFNMKSSASGKKSPNPDLPKNVLRTQIKQTGARLLYPKRPIDISCLEKGPPEKNLKLDSSLPPFFGSFFGEESMNSAIVGEPNKDSVLRNLLVNGEDLNNGYSVIKRPLTSPRVTMELLCFNSTSSMPPTSKSLLPRLTQSDCDVNAPVLSNGLLHGNEILKALEVDVDTSIIIGP